MRTYGMIPVAVVTSLALALASGCQREQEGEPGNGQEAAGQQMPAPQGEQQEAKQPREEQAQGEQAATPPEQAPSRDEGDQGEATAESGEPPGKLAAAQLGCSGCHAVETTRVGPSWQAMANRYGANKAEVLNRIESSVENGAQGNWTDVSGGMQMAAQPQAAEQTEKLAAIAEWVAGMAK